MKPGERHDSGALIVFAREPRAGEVKTRLARDVGDAAAARTYAALLTRTLALAGSSRFTARYLYAATAADHDYFRARLDARWQVRAQPDGDIGVRMADALGACLEAHRFAVLIGSDVADNTVADLDAAHDALAQASVTSVLGPSADGGYWLIGVRELFADLFDGLPWSSAAVFATTLKRIDAAGASCRVLDERHDVDVAADLRFMA